MRLLKNYLVVWEERKRKQVEIRTNLLKQVNLDCEKTILRAKKIIYRILKLVL